MASISLDGSGNSYAVFNDKGTMLTWHSSYNDVKSKPNPYEDLIPERVIFNNKTTICFWKDGSKTVVACSDGDEFSEEEGILQCIARRIFNGNRSAFLRIVENAYYQPQSKK